MRTRPSEPIETPPVCGLMLQSIVMPTASPPPSVTVAVKGALKKSAAPSAGTV